MHAHKSSICTLCAVKNIFRDEYYCHWSVLSKSSIPKDNPSLIPRVLINLNKAKPSVNFQGSLENIFDFSIKMELTKQDEKVRLIYSELYQYAALFEERSKEHKRNLKEDLCGFTFGPLEVEMGQDIQTRIRQMVVLSQAVHLTSKCVSKEAIKELEETILDDRCALFFKTLKEK